MLSSQKKGYCIETTSRRAQENIRILSKAKKNEGVAPLSWPAFSLIVRALARAVERQSGARQPVALLSRREMDIVTMVAAGMRNKEIANRLVGEGTVKTHIHTIYKKLSIHGRGELTLMPGTLASSDR